MTNVPGRSCAWCEGPIPHTARRDAVTCSKRCRQARHRFVRGVGQPTATMAGAGGRRLAYADPPYPELSARYYGDHPDFAGEVDHAQLLEQLSTFDGWALSTSARALPDVLRICPPGVRVAAWHRGAASFARSSYALNAWEPVIYVPVPAPVDAIATVQRDTYAPGYRDGSGLASHDGSTPAPRDGSAEDPRDGSGEVLRDASRSAERDGSAAARTRTDSLVYVARPRTTDPSRVVGAKPAAFARWLFELLGASPADQLVDLFPGSGGIARAWKIYAADQNALEVIDTVGG